MIDFDLSELVIEVDEDALFVGQTFQTQEEAFTFCNNYAKKHGFMGVKDRTNTRHGRTIRQDFHCHCYGKPRPKVFDMSKNRQNKSSSKCGCYTRLRITLKQSFDIFSEEWHVTVLVKQHNHPMLSHEELRFLLSNRSITPQDEKKILLYKEAGLSIRQIIRVMELEKNLKHGELSVLERDIRNLYGKVKKLLGVEDANNLKEY